LQGGGRGFESPRLHQLAASVAFSPLSPPTPAPSPVATARTSTAWSPGGPRRERLPQSV